MLIFFPDIRFDYICRSASHIFTENYDQTI